MGRPLLAAGTPTSIGSLPHGDPVGAASFVLDRHPELPAAPQLPRRSKREAMLAQAAAGVRGVEIGVDGRLRVHHELFDPDAPVEARVTSVESAGLLAFLDAVAGAGRTDPVKLQLTGPVTLGLGLVRAGAAPEAAFTAARRATRARARALVELAEQRIPGVPLVVFLDEPGLTACRHPGFPLDPDATVDLVSTGLAALGHKPVTGVHCCGITDWSVPIMAGAQVLSFPAEAVTLPEPARLAAFLEDGGWVAWGAVPTDRPIGDDAEPLWRKLVGLWQDLVREGCDAGRLRAQALVTPACGLAHHGLSQADRVLRLTRGVAQRLAGKDTATFLSLGA